MTKLNSIETIDELGEYFLNVLNKVLYMRLQPNAVETLHLVVKKWENGSFWDMSINTCTPTYHIQNPKNTYEKIFQMCIPHSSFIYNSHIKNAFTHKVCITVSTNVLPVFGSSSLQIIKEQKVRALLLNKRHITKLTYEYTNPQKGNTNA